MAVNASSVAVTTSAGGGAVLAVPVITWVLNGCPRPIPETVEDAIAIAIVPVAHCLYLAFGALVNRWAGAPVIQVPAPAAAPPAPAA